MHTGALMALRQFLGQYLAYAKPWQRVLVAIGVVAGGVLLIAAGIATGHVALAVIGGVLLLATGNACVAVGRARRARPREKRLAQAIPGGVYPVGRERGQRGAH